VEALEYLKDGSLDGMLPWSVHCAATKHFLSHAAVEGFALERGLLPGRYQHHQARLFASRVAVIGCGGLGGYIIEELARLGVGQIVAEQKMYNH
jgi:molybdopterin/thiamine biosynthesis adenylyltransferase